MICYTNIYLFDVPGSSVLVYIYRLLRSLWRFTPWNGSWYILNSAPSRWPTSPKTCPSHSSVLQPLPWMNPVFRSVFFVSWEVMQKLKTRFFPGVLEIRTGEKHKIRKSKMPLLFKAPSLQKKHSCRMEVSEVIIVDRVVSWSDSNNTADRLTNYGSVGERLEFSWRFCGVEGMNNRCWDWCISKNLFWQKPIMKKTSNCFMSFIAPSWDLVTVISSKWPSLSTLRTYNRTFRLASSKWSTSASSCPDSCRSLPGGLKWLATNLSSKGHRSTHWSRNSSTEPLILWHWRWEINGLPKKSFVLFLFFNDNRC